MSGSRVINTILEREGLKPATFAKRIGITPTQVYDLQSGKTKKVSAKVAERILAEYPNYSYSWLVSGAGEILKNEALLDATLKSFALDGGIQAQLLSCSSVIHVPLVNQYAYAGYLSGYQTDTYIDSLPTIPFIADHEMKGNYIAFEVKGDSMNDGTEESYLEGDKLFCREIPQHLWVDSKLHIRKWDFVIVHEEGILIKRIIDHDVQNHTITVHSLNDFYPDKVIDLADVRQIFNVVEMQRPKRR